MFLRKLTLLAAVAACACSPALAAPKGATPAAFTPDRAYSGATPWTAAPENNGGPLRFAVVGDRTGLARPGVFEQAMKQIGWLQPDFIIDVGDMIEGYTEDRAELTAMWDQVEGFARGSGRPFIFVPGNHDLGNGVMLDVWRQRHGAEYYAFAYKGALFIALDSEDPPTPMSPAMAAQFHGTMAGMAKDPDGVAKMIDAFYAEAEAREKAGKPASDDPAAVKAKAEADALNVANFSDKQIAFVRDTLAAHKDARQVFVFMHKPAWKVKSTNWGRIEALLKDKPYTVFAGHNHYFTHEVRDGRDYIDMGTTGGIGHKQGPGVMDHTMFVTVTPQGPSYANIRLNGLMDLDGQTGQTRAR